MTRRVVAWANLSPLGVHTLAARVLAGVGASPRKSASRFEIHGGGDFSFKFSVLALSLELGVGFRVRGDEELSIGVNGSEIDFIGRTQLHHRAQVHHGHPIRNVTHHGEVVGNE